MAGFLVALTICLSLSEGIHSNHNCRQEQCIFCIEAKQLRKILNHIRIASAIWIWLLVGLPAGSLFVFAGEREKPSLVNWKVRMDH